MLAKIIVHRSDRAQALAALDQALNDTQLYGTQTNLRYLQALLVDPVVQAGGVTTRYLNEFSWTPARIDVISGGNANNDTRCMGSSRVLVGGCAAFGCLRPMDVSLVKPLTEQ